jgi:tRNA nucleotidyltransferase (CCA-adding enzyme)
MHKNVLKRIKPSRKEELELKDVAKEVMSKIKIPNTVVELGGSSAKGTWLKGNHDIDIYVKFNPKYYEGMNISETLQKVVKKATVVHGSRDYLQLEVREFEIELIPIININDVEDADNITDISPFHKKWVLQYKQYADDIRLAKAFAKANGLYGAESYIRGFSGYSIEVLTIYYKGFDNLIKNVAKWKTKTVLDIEKHHRGRVRLNKSKTVSPLIVIDPVQSTRNVTAVVSREKYNLFKKIAKKYLKNPSDEFFEAKQFSLNDLKKKRKNAKLICLKLEPLDGKRDVVGAKLLKSFEFMKRELFLHDFSVKDAGWDWSEAALLWFIVENKSLSSKVKHYGPPTDKKDRLKHFKEKWKGTKIKEEEGKSYVLINRKYKVPEKVLFDAVNNEYVTSRISQVIAQLIFK